MNLQPITISKTCANGRSVGAVQVLNNLTRTISAGMLTALVVSTTAYAQDKTSEIDKIFGGATPTTPGCVCAVSQNGKVVVNRAYGSADLERGVPLSPGTLFDIGSTRKQFIAAAVLLLVEEKRLSLSDDVRKYLPELPDYGHTITLDHLLTHTSGIRDWTGLMPLANGKPDALTLILRQRGLNFAPGEEWSYSNSGYVLLTEIVARRSGMAFADFLRQRLFEPLGMKSSAYVVDILQGTGDRALGYQKDGTDWKPHMRLGNERGGGAVISTAADLLLWNEALTSGRLGAFVSEKLQEPAKLNNGRKLGYARGLLLETYRGTGEIGHSGGAAGYSSWLGRFPERRLSVAVLCNSDVASATALAHRVADQFLPATDSPTPLDGPPPALTGDTLLEVNRKVGLFFNERTGEPMRLAVDRGRFRIAGGPALVPVTKDRFRRWGALVQFKSQDEFELNFQSPDQFELKSMEGQTARYRRARPFVPTVTDLQAFAGRYESDEIGAFFDIAPGKDGLMGRANEAPGAGFPFKAVDHDTFQLGGVMVRFLRDQAGNVVALDYSNPVIRSIKFTRRDERTNRP
jgi:CubicO group peptidase (beta-lactamase class C family)